MRSFLLSHEIPFIFMNNYIAFDFQLKSNYYSFSVTNANPYYVNNIRLMIDMTEL